MSERKVFILSGFKALGDAPGSEAGTFEAIVSVFGNVDLGGDVVQPGAFEKSLAEWRAAGDPIPVIWSHDWEDPYAHIGGVDPNLAEETDAGLKVVGTLDVQTNPFAAQVYRLLKERRVKEFSFAYEVNDSEDQDGVRNLRELSIIEVGPTLKGMNPATQLLAVKADQGTPAEEIQEEVAGEQATESETPSVEDQEAPVDTEDGASEDGKSEEPSAAKLDDRISPAVARVQAELIALEAGA